MLAIFFWLIVAFGFVITIYREVKGKQSWPYSLIIVLGLLALFILSLSEN
jgi:hypothetical protein